MNYNKVLREYDIDLTNLEYIIQFLRENDQYGDVWESEIHTLRYVIRYFENL